MRIESSPVDKIAKTVWRSAFCQFGT